MNRNAAKTALSILRKYFHNICGLTFNDIATHEFAATHTHIHIHIQEDTCTCCSHL